MPDESMSEALREAYAMAPVDRVIVDTLELRHPAFRDAQGLPDSAWLTTNRKAISATIEADAPVRGGETIDFISLAFRFRLAPIELSPTPVLQLQIDNVNRLIVQQLDLAAADPNKILMVYRPFLAGDFSTPQILPAPSFTLSDAKVDPLSLRATARVDIDLNGAFPGNSYTAALFAALIGQ